MGSSPEALKRAAASAALGFVRSDMVLGLGTGSTVRHLLDLLADSLRMGRLTGVVGVPTSIQTETRALELGIDLIGLGDAPSPHLTIDGADEVSPDLDLIKGMGGALLREKMVAQASDRLVIIADSSKLVQRLGSLSPLPIEVVEWGMRSHVTFMEGLGAVVTVRTAADGSAVRSDNGNLFLDCRFPGGIDDPAELDASLAGRAGVVESGFFLGIADTVVVAAESGVRTMAREA